MTYSRAIVGMNAISVLWWAVDFAVPDLGWLDSLVPVYFAAMFLAALGLPLWIMNRPMGRPAAAAVFLGSTVNILGSLRAIGSAAEAMM